MQDYQRKRIEQAQYGQESTVFRSSEGDESPPEQTEDKQTMEEKGWPSKTEVDSWNELEGADPVYDPKMDERPGYSSFLTTSGPRALFVALWVFLSQQGIAPIVSKDRWSMKFSIASDLLAKVSESSMVDQSKEADQPPLADVEVTYRQTVSE